MHLQQSPALLADTAMECLLARIEATRGFKMISLIEL
jgi:hypothetical protein